MKRRLSAILAADMVGYSRLMEADEAGTIARQKVHLSNSIEPIIKQYHGRIVKLMGDGILVEFDSVIDAVKCAVSMQGSITEQEAKIDEERRIEFRIGINLGDVFFEDGDILGDGVNIAARLEQLAKPGGIYISGTVFDHLKSNVDVGYESLGEVHVKNIQHPIRAYRILTDPEQAGTLIGISRKKSTSKIWTAAAAILVIAIIGGVVWWWAYQTQTALIAPSKSVTDNPENFTTKTSKYTPPLSEKQSIAVLPFSNLSGEKDQEYFSDGMTEDLITDLSQISGLFIIARNSVFTYKGRSVKVQQVGQELGVKFVLEGSVRKVGDRVRINAQLIDTQTGGHIWASRYDRKLTDVFALQDEVITKIVEALTVKLKPDELERLKVSTQVHPEAYDVLLRGIEKYRRFTAETNLEARAFFEQAINLDPKFARAHADLALTYSAEAARQWNNDPDNSNQRALIIAKHALGLDSSIAQVQFVFGAVYRNLMRIDDAIEASKRAISIDPNYADAYASLAMNLNYSGNPIEGLVAINHAGKLNPLKPFLYVWAEGQSQYLLGNYEEAARLFEQVKLSNPQFSGAHQMLAVTYIELGRSEDAEWAVAELLTISPNFTLSTEKARSPYTKNAVLTRYIDNLRKAGIE